MTYLSHTYRDTVLPTLLGFLFSIYLSLSWGFNLRMIKLTTDLIHKINSQMPYLTVKIKFQLLT